MSERVHRLTVDDLEGCRFLARDRGWPDEPPKWRLLFTIGSVYGIRDDAGALVGTAALTRYGPSFAVISMVLVATRSGGRGLGRRLMEHALAEAGDAVVSLFATEDGRPLYEKLGFATISTVHTHLGPMARTADPVGSRPATPADLPAIGALDAETFGADRGHLISRLPDVLEQLRVVERSGSITGYAGAWRSPGYTGVGPVVAPDPAQARTLIADLARTINGPLRLDLDEHRPDLRAWATAVGVPPLRTTAVMLRGAESLPGAREHLFSPVMQALG